MHKYVRMELHDFTLIDYNTQGCSYLGLILDKKAFRIYANRPPLYEQGKYPNLSKNELELCRQVIARNNPAMVL